MFEHEDLVHPSFPSPGTPTDVSSMRSLPSSINTKIQPRLQDLTSPADSDMGGALKVPNPHREDPWNKPNLRD